MMPKSSFAICLLLVIIFFDCSKTKPLSPIIIPSPQNLSFSTGVIDLSNGFTIKINNPELEPLQKVIQQDYFLLFGIKLEEGKTSLNLAVNPKLKKEEYQLIIEKDISITGGSYGAVALALSSLWQGMNEEFKIPRMTIADHPLYNYRSIMLDVARAWHSPETIKKIIDLCRWYKINYLHLHLTDDSAFSFPSDAFPVLATENHSYTKAQLVELNQYAYDRGVILVPELDVPGHTSEILRKMPELFGIAKVENSPYTISMAREETYQALDVLISEIAAVFSYSPYVHIGGDEAFFGGMEDDPATLAYMKKHELPNIHELFRHFLIRLDDSVKKTGKQTIVWAGFGEKGELEIPKDVIVMLWEHIYHDPHDLLENNYPIINASFKPLYIVNNRKWDAQYIYNQWTPNRWESWAHEGDFFGVELEENDQVMGATMCAWEQNQIHQMPRLRNRVAGMAQHLWSQPSLPWEEFWSQQQKTDQRLEQLNLPFEIKTEGLLYPDLGEGNFYEHLWFGKNIELVATNRIPELQLEYATERDPKAKDWQSLPNPFILEETTPLHIRAVDAQGQAIGNEFFQNYHHQPIKISTKGLWKDLPIGSWEKLRFEDTLWLSLSTAYENSIIRYQTKGGVVDSNSILYEGPIPITETSHLRAQVFDQEGKKIGSTLRETYFKIWYEESLTTGKPISASNDHIRPNGAAPANNGRITLWEMWGDHVDVENWVKVDLEQSEEISRLKVYTFWDNWRYYQYTIEGSLNGENWFQLVDFSQNTQMATHEGIEHKIKPTKARFLRINMLYNSANPGLHLVEFGAFE